MQSMKNIKIWIGLIYLIILSFFLYFLFSKFSIQEITSYNFIRTNSEYLVNFRESNLALVSIIFIVFGVLWISVLLGFGSPLVLASGFLFGVYFGTIVAVITLSLGASLTYIIANYFFKDLIKEKFSNKFKFLEEKIKLNEFFIIFLLRVIGGTPLQIQNILPVFFNVKLKNYFFGSLTGFLPQAFVFCSLGAGLENQIKKNTKPPSFFELITSFEIYGPIMAFFLLLILAFIARKLFFKN
tara:strand:+ start:689 stop:1411 length:723 start_codon:yes stop_codon:yes gene_type:complete